MRIEKLTGAFTTSTGTQSIAYDSATYGGDPVCTWGRIYTNTSFGAADGDNGWVTFFYDGTTLATSFGFFSGASGKTEAQRGRNVASVLMDNGGGTTQVNATLSYDTTDNDLDFVFTTIAGAFYYEIYNAYGSDVLALSGADSGVGNTVTTNWGVPPKFVLTAGASTSSSTTPNGAANWGASDGTNVGGWRIGQDDGTQLCFARHMSNASAMNIFGTTSYGLIAPNNFQNNSFDLAFSDPNSNDAAEETIYLAVYCDNPVELLSNQTLTDKATNASEPISVSHEPEYLIAGGGVDVAAADTLYNNTNGVNVFHGFADLSAGAGASADYFASRWVFKRSDPETGQLELTDSYLLFGIDYDATPEDFEATVSAKSASSITISKALGDSAVRFWLLNIGAEPAASNPETTVGDATAAGLDASARTTSASADASAVGLDASARTTSAVADATAAGLDANPRVVTTVADATAAALDAQPRASTELATASAAGLDATPRVRTEVASATSTGLDATARTTTATAGATAAGLDATPRVRTTLADAVAAGLDAAPGGGFPTSTDWNETDYDNALTAADLFDNESFSGYPATFSIPEDYNAHTHYAATEAQSWSDYTFTGKLYRAASTIGLGVTVYSDYPNSDTYYRLRVNGTTSVWDLNGHPDAGGSPISDSFSGPNPTNTEVDFKIRVTNESGQVRVQAKVWTGGEEAEPGAWSLEAVDTDAGRPTAGTIGLWTSHNPSVSNTSKAYWYDLRIDLGDGNGSQAIPLQSTATVTELAVASAAALDGRVNPTSTVATATAEALEALADVTLVAGASAEAFDAQVGNYQTSVTQYGITWTFDGSYRVGQYITGDWWVLAPSGMTINSVSPTPTATRNNSMKNPLTQSASGYDSRVHSADMSLRETFPLAMSAGDSLVSTISAPEDPTNETDLIGKNTSNAFLSTAAVLTVVATEPSSTAFRPQYSGNGVKTTYDFANVDTSLLPGLAPTAGSIVYNAQGGTDVEAIERQFARPWIFHASDFIGRQIHPKQNMPDYHEYVYEVIADAAMKLCTTEWTQDMLVGFIQAGIDNYYCALSGTPDSSGNKWLSIFAGIMLGETALQNDSRSYRTGLMAYYIAAGTSSLTSSVVTSGETWTGATVGWRQDPGNNEHEHLDPATEWNDVPLTGGGGKREHYRRENSKTWPGFALAARLMNAVATWDHAAFFDYVDRWMTEPDSSNYSYLLSLYSAGTINGDPTSTGAEQASSDFVTSMWAAYRDSAISEVATAAAAGLNASARTTTSLATATAAALDATPAGETEIATASAAGLDATPRVRTAAATATAAALDAVPRVRTVLADAVAAGLDASLPDANPTSEIATAAAVSLDASARTRTAPADAIGAGLNATARTMTAIAQAVAEALEARNRSSAAPAVAIAVALDGTPVFSQSVRERVLSAIIAKLNAITPVGYDREDGNWAFRLRLDDVQYPNPFIFVSVASEAKRETSHHYDCTLEVEITAFLSTSDGAGDAVLDQIVSDVEGVVIANPQWSSTAIDTELEGHERGRLEQPRQLVAVVRARVSYRHARQNVRSVG